MKKLFPLLCIAFLLSGCGTTTVTKDDPNHYVSPDTRFSLDLNENFIIVPTTEKSAETIFAAVDLAHEKDGITPNINIVKQELPKAFPAYFVAKSSVQKSAETLAEYKKKSTEDITLDGQKTILHTFQIQKLVYMQTYLMSGPYAYTITATYYPETPEDVMAEYRRIIESFHFLTEVEKQAILHPEQAVESATEPVTETPKAVETPTESKTDASTDKSFFDFLLGR